MSTKVYPYNRELRQQAADYIYNLLPAMYRVRDQSPQGSEELKTFLQVLSTPLAHAADPQVLPEVQFRPRMEADTGRDFTAGQGDVVFVTHRARLGATVLWPRVSTRLVFADSRAWGEELDTRRDFAADGLDLPIGTFTWHPDDRFSLTVAGVPGGTLVGPEAFRHGPLSLAMAELLEPGSGGAASRAPALGLEEAVRRTAAALRRGLNPSDGASVSASASSWNTLNGTSRFTGPGRPLSMVVIAWRSASGSISTRVGWKLCLTTGRTTLVKSAWLCRLIS